MHFLFWLVSSGFADANVLTLPPPAKWCSTHEWAPTSSLKTWIKNCTGSGSFFLFFLLLLFFFLASIFQKAENTDRNSKIRTQMLKSEKNLGNLGGLAAMLSCTSGKWTYLPVFKAVTARLSCTNGKWTYLPVFKAMTWPDMADAWGWEVGYKFMLGFWFFSYIGSIWW